MTVEATERTVSSLAVPFSMVHGPGNFVLRLSNDAPTWQMASGDYLIVRPASNPRACVTGVHVVVEMRETGALRFLRRVRYAGDHWIALEKENGETTSYSADYPPFSVVGVLAGVIRKY